jgi:CheY-like chemotaxis protein
MPSVSRVECIARQPCDGVQMGEQLPVRDGLEARCETVPRWPVGMHPRSMAMAANAMQGDRNACLAAGVNTARPARASARILGGPGTAQCRHGEAIHRPTHHRSPAMDTTFNPAARWSELTAWFLGRPAAVATAAPAVRRDRSLSLASPERHISAGSTLRMEQPLGTELVCLEGTLWVTHDGEEHDHIVVAGKPYVACHGSTMLVHAMSESRCLVIAPRD